MLNSALSRILGGKQLSEVRKALIAVAGLAAQLVTLGVVPDNLLPYVSGALGLLAAAGVYVVPNADAPVADAPVADAPAATDPAPAADVPDAPAPVNPAPPAA